MFFTRAQLLEKIRLGEDSLLEFKEIKIANGKIRGPNQDDLADEIAAFANSFGGTLLLGIDDKTRQVIGIPLQNIDAVETLVREACSNSIKPPVVPLIERMMLPAISGIEQPILKVEIQRSLFVHQSPGGYLHRVGSSKRPMPPDYLARLFQQRSQSRLILFDETPILNAELSVLDEKLWHRFVNFNTPDSAETLLSKLGMARQDETGVWRPTIAGLLIACRHPHNYLPGSFIQAVAYQGNDAVPQNENIYQRDARDITGPLDQQIFEACAFVQKNMKIAAVKGNQGGRKDIPQFDLLSVFEAITNAVAHRDYSIFGAKVRLRMFDDRLEIISPGMLPNTMTTESLPYRQIARNETVTSLLARCPVNPDIVGAHRTYIMDKRGEGVPILLRRSKELSGKEPVYRIVDDSELWLTIYAAGETPIVS